MSDSAEIRGNVLVVEDDADTGQLILRVLSTAGYGVRLTPSRDQAVTALKRYIYDYIILDLRMAGMSPETFLKIAKLSARDITIVLMTAVEDAECEALRLGIPNWIGKPFEPVALIKCLRLLSSGIRTRLRN
jgi:DNA-binding response OmpR family regulator